MSQFLFYFLSLAAIAFAVGVVTVKSPMKSVLSLLGSFAALAVIYLLMGFQFLAAAQLLVYAGAIMVLFLFVVMLLDMSDVNAVFDRSRQALGQKRVAIAALSAGTLGAIALLAAGTVQASENVGPMPIGGYDRLDYFAGLLFSRYMIPFQAAALLLLATMIGVLVLAKRRRSDAASDQPSSAGIGTSGAQR